MSRTCAPLLQSSVPVPAVATTFSTQVLVGVVNEFGIESGAPKKQPTSVQSRFDPVSVDETNVTWYGTAVVDEDGALDGGVDEINALRMRTQEQFPNFGEVDDLANFEEVVRLHRDADVRRELTANARRDLVDSGSYSYAALVGELDEQLVSKGLRPELADDRRELRARRGRGGMVAGHEPRLAPPP